MAREHIARTRKALGMKAKTNAIKLLIADEATARDFIDTINPEDIASWQPGYAIAWRHCRDALLRGVKPSRGFLVQSIRESAEASMVDVEDDVINEAVELVRSAYKMEVTDDVRDKARRNCERMLQEQVYLNMQADFDAGNVPDDIPDFFSKLNDRIVQSAPPQKNLGHVFEGEWWKTVKFNRRSTHVKVYDRILGGGAAGGWVVGFAAPFGAGKTALVADAACAITQYEKPTEDGRRPIVAIFTFETPRSEYLLRLLSRYAMILSTRLQDVGYEGLRGKDDPMEPYEHALAKTMKLASEKTRARKAVEAMREGIMLFDISNMEEENRTVKSIAAIANQVMALNTESTYVHSVWIDHTSAVVDHIIATSDGQYGPEHRTELIRTLPQELRKQVAKKFDVPVILLAQLSGLANARSAAAPMGGTDVEGCKSFGMYLDINVVSGRGTPDGFRAWYSDKNRHGPIVPRLIVNFDGRFYKFTDATDNMTIDDATRTFIPAKDAGKVGIDPGRYVPTPRNKTEPKRQNITL